jgi:phage terminase small subunit
MQNKGLLKSQQELFRLKQAQAQAAQADLQATLNTIASELGIDPNEHWTLSPDLTRLEKMEPPTKK